MTGEQLTHWPDKWVQDARPITGVCLGCGNIIFEGDGDVCEKCGSGKVETDTGRLLCIFSLIANRVMGATYDD